ncbi:MULTISPECIES: MFS transporter [unclassified Rhizobium]|uniref:MFS transporter n=1 Tax=unclassified Rhizobium TaxID=2613769 RepID=UPI001616E6E7|nr:MULTISPECIES: MFS transporter [unclassified Rhizobium]MBB3386237.1 MFS family permease [Rhizobium sp. BK098]MBB3571757.1 MFS family permease [Rhizobium sp. BK491]MBB3617941.1 MFS family permease [Rhizobium sp. BK609]MBB3683606.1 MFS family permease [Rhizobium sp. BK612]
MGRNVACRVYLCCVVTSSAGRNAYFVLTAWIAVDVSHGASVLAILLALGSAAELLTSNVGGALVDRFDRSIVCMSCDLLRLALMVSTGVGLSFVDPLLILYISWTIFAIVDRTHLTALQALIPSIVGPEKLWSFNSASYIGMQAGNLLAAIVTGFALTAKDTDLTPVLPGVCFILSLLAPWAMRNRWQRSSSQQRSIRDGIRCLDLLPTTSTLRSLKASASIYALIYTMGMLVNVLASAYVIHELDGTAVQFGYLEAGWAFGSIAGCASFLSGHRCWRQNILVHLGLAGLFLLGFWVVPSFVFALFQMTILGLSYNIARVLIDVQVQSTVPVGMLGRARSQIHTICVAVGLLGYGIIGFLGSAVLPSQILGFFGAVMIAVALFLYFTRDRGGPLKSRLV